MICRLCAVPLRAYGGFRNQCGGVYGVRQVFNTVILIRRAAVLYRRSAGTDYIRAVCAINRQYFRLADTIIFLRREPVHVTR